MAKAYFAAIEQNPVPAVDLYEKLPMHPASLENP